MSRTAFLMKEGFTCNNWRGSWSFIDVTNKRIVFGAWEDLKNERGDKVLILGDDWEKNRKGRKKSGYKQSAEHINKLINEGYNLYTFSQTRRATSDERDAASIKSFVPKLSPKFLERMSNGWYAVDENSFTYSPILDDKYYEGASALKTTTYYERNPKARMKCIKYHGLSCKVCGFDFYKIYGELGKNYIQVHHLKKISEIKQRYLVDPINDLVPVCANCHAMIHIGEKMLTVQEMQTMMKNK